MAQAKVLRAIETREIQPLGGVTTTQLDVRVVTATHHDLEQLAVERRFREDLFFSSECCSGAFTSTAGAPLPIFHC